jgi:hypothetical protein
MPGHPVKRLSLTGESAAVPASTGRDDARAPVRTRSLDTSAELVLLTLSIANAAAWYGLFRWYGLLENRNNTHFSFEKVPGGFDSSQLRQTALLFLLATLIYVAGFLFIRSLPGMSLSLKGLTGLFIAGPVVANVLLYPVAALDVFNYMIELKLAYHYDQNPYLVTFEAYREDPFALPAFLVDVRLFYGPVWLLVSWLPVAIAGMDDVIRLLIALKIFNVLLLGITAWAIAHYGEDRRRGWLAGLLFLANPLVLFEGVGNAHNDVMMTCFLILAMLALRKQSPMAGPLLALSALVKFYTLALVPIFLVAMLAGKWGWRRIGATAGLTLVSVVLVCAPYWSGGEMVDGLREGLERSQQMDHVSLYSLAQQYELEQEALGSGDPDFIRSRPSAEIISEATKDSLRNGFALAFILGAGLLALSVRRGRSVEAASAETLMLFVILLTNLYPWYLIPILAVLALRPDRSGIAYLVGATVLGLVYYPMFVYAHFNTEWSRYEVHQFLALFLTAPILVLLLVRWGGPIAQRLSPRLRSRAAT